MPGSSPIDRRATASPEVWLGVVAPIPSIGAQPGDLLCVRRGARRSIVLQREVLESHGVTELRRAIGKGTARILDGTDEITLAKLKPSPSAPAPLRLIRGGVR